MGKCDLQILLLLKLNATTNECAYDNEGESTVSALPLTTTPVS